MGREEMEKDGFVFMGRFPDAHEAARFLWEQRGAWVAHIYMGKSEEEREYAEVWRDTQASSSSHVYLIAVYLR